MYACECILVLLYLLIWIIIVARLGVQPVVKHEVLWSITGIYFGIKPALFAVWRGNLFLL